MEYRFGPACANDAEQIFDLIRQRIAWMAERTIRQWDESYWTIFPPAHYYAAIRDQRLMVLREEKSGAVVSAAVLAEEDWRWTDNCSAFYLHNFVTALSVPGIGDLFLRHCEDHARACGKEALRLDCDAANQKLCSYYAQHGYQHIGTVADGDALGLRWEKRLAP